MLKKEVDKLLVEQRKQLNAGRVRKSDIDKMLVDERKKMREAQKESKFKQRTLSIYKNQVARANELGLLVDYTIDEFRDFVRERFEAGKCYYCEHKITLSNFAADHKLPVSKGGAFTLANLAICDKPCNFQKGKLTEDEFVSLNVFLATQVSAESATDIRARLTTGGKWMPH
jgi:5-methylcytosine-specific restriction endonuclease McrA